MWEHDMDAVLGILRRELALRLRDGVRNGISEVLRTAATLIVVGAVLLVCTCIGALME